MTTPSIETPQTTPTRMPHPSKKRVSMRTIAEQTGVTKTTVSLALRGDKSIPEKTRLRIVKLAKELNYRPDPAISAIAAQRWSGSSPERHHVIAFLCNKTPEWRAMQMDYYDAAKQRADELGYRLELFVVDEYPRASSITRVLQARGIRGVIVPQIHNPESKRTMNLEWNNFTAVCCAVGRIRPPLHTVTTDYFETTRRAWNIVQRAGFTRIGASLSCHNPIAGDDWHRVGASHASITLYGLTESAKIPFNNAPVTDEDALLRWYEKYTPEVIIGFNDHTGKILEKHGIRMPEDVEFVSLIAKPGSQWSGMSHDFDQVSIDSVNLLVNELRENRWGIPDRPNLILVHPHWNAGKTFSKYREESFKPSPIPAHAL